MEPKTARTIPATLATRDAMDSTFTANNSPPPYFVLSPNIV
nr:MAG TPA: hypothetical protein [Caudoviricetes sp.]